MESRMIRLAYQKIIRSYQNITSVKIAVSDILHNLFTCDSESLSTLNSKLTAMKTKLLLLVTIGFIIGIGLLLTTCSKDEGEEMTFEEAIQHEALSEEQVDYYDNQQSKEFYLDEIFLPNGLTVEEFLQDLDKKDSNKGDNNNLAKKDPVQLKNEILAKVLSNASYFTERTNFPIVAEGPNKPAQEGLAYSFGQRDYTHRLPPPEGLCKDWEIYGLDCSGFVYHCFLRNLGIDLCEGGWTCAERQRKSDFMTRAIKRKYSDFNELRVHDFGYKPVSEIESGDIIYWMRLNEETNEEKAWHIGIVFRVGDPNTGELWVAQSNGSNGKEGDCETNWSTQRGPRNFILSNCIGPSPNFGNNYGILRIGLDTPDPPDYNRISVMVKVYAQYQGFMGTRDNAAIQDYKAYTGEFKQDNLFEAVGTFKDMMGTLNVSGKITVQFNYRFDSIYWLKWSEVRNKSADNYVKAHTETSSCWLINLPKAYNGIYEVKGGTTGHDPCNHIKDLDHAWIGENSSSLRNWLCTYKSHVYVALSKE